MKAFVPSLFAGRNLAASMLFVCSSLFAVDLAVTNSGFENTTGQTVYNEFTFGVPVGWDLYNPANLNGGATNNGFYPGTLEPNGVEFFPVTAPEGDRVAILFNSNFKGGGEYGFSQTLTDILTPNTQYTLTVEVGNITSGYDEANNYYDLSNFPGYRVDFIAGESILASDNNSLTIAEGEWGTSTVSFTTGSSVTPGQNLRVRLVNLNSTTDSPDNEVDFDDVRLTAVAVPESRSGALLFGFALMARLACRPRR